MKSAREMSPQLFVTLNTYTLHLSLCTQTQLRRHLPNPFREFPSSWSQNTIIIANDTIARAKDTIVRRKNTLTIANDNMNKRHNNHNIA